LNKNTVCGGEATITPFRFRMALQAGMSGRLGSAADAITRRNTMENIVIGIIACLLFIYLFVAMLRPEKF
jgi:K+-transporting ATPase KdpF subunit